MAKTVKTATATDMIKLIGEFLDRNDKESRDLWDVLAALRGPDVSSIKQDIKRRTTSRIRHAIGIREAESINGAIVTSGPIDIRPNEDSEIHGYHFVGHTLRAKGVLERLGFIAVDDLIK